MMCGWCSDLCEDVESKHKIGEIIDELAEKKPQKQAKSTSGSSTPAHRHGRRSAVAPVVLLTFIGDDLIAWNSGLSVR